ncbi:hypothetical protein XACM_2584 [Xanthomonas euvesicatoria pv. citrumelo F1]|nr:hypothetical protein XACM_2584 [Xanthomonas euvesicatoria pv. citrumelo F1]
MELRSSCQYWPLLIFLTCTLVLHKNRQHWQIR